MEYKRLILEKEGHIGTVTFNRPESGNAFDFRIMEEIDHVFREDLDKDDTIRAVILTGAGKYFCTGVDLTMFVDADALVDKDELEQGVASSRVGEETEELPWGNGLYNSVPFLSNYH